MIAIVQYGCGNVQAIANIYKRLDVPVAMATTAEELRSADRIILPGVGAFDWAMTRLNDSGMRAALDEAASTKPILGICVGMQMMAEASEEGELPGLGWIKGRVRRFDETKISQRTHLPHMGWNDVRPVEGGRLFEGLDAWRFYFLHSYFFDATDAASVRSQTDYYGWFASGVGRDNLHGVQFHPEKSHHWGIQLLKNFSEL
jgi:imidazole glycerol-phosphate synthase subunit HisH